MLKPFAFLCVVFGLTSFGQEPAQKNAPRAAKAKVGPDSKPTIDERFDAKPA